jgi:hypothetical protein
MSRRTIHNWKEEVNPCGDSHALRLMSDRGDISHVQAIRVESHPWFIMLWEPLKTKAPGPHLTYVWTCYINTVIFYQRGHILRPFTTPLIGRPWRFEAPNCRYQEWDKVESSLRCDAVVEFEKELYRCHPGQVVWKKKRWWIRRAARREEVKHA